MKGSVTILYRRGIFMTYAFIFTVLLVFISIGVLYYLEDKKYEFNLGGAQGEVIRGITDLKSKENYVKKSLILDTKSEINSFLDKPSFEDVMVDDYVLWKKGGTECFPNDWNIIKNYLTSNLNDDYEDLEINLVRGDNSIIVKTTGNLEFISDSENYNIKTSKPMVSESTIENFNFDSFLSKVDKIEEISNKCKEDKICWELEFSTLEGFNLVENKDKLFKFEFITLGLIEDIRIKAAVDFEEELNIGEEELKC